jgi:hypothetical protein
MLAALTFLVRVWHLQVGASAKLRRQFYSE